MVDQPSSRDIRRGETFGRIVDCAHRRLVAEGVEGVTLRPIAGDVGLTAPGLYRYFPGREQLLAELSAVVYDLLSDSIEAARDRVDEADLVGRFIAVMNAFRGWSLDHRNEFRLIFATPFGNSAADNVRLGEAGKRLGRIFLNLFADLWFRQGFPVAAAGDMAPEMAEQLERWVARDDIPLPLPAVQVFLECWVQVYGLISMEVFGHLGFALENSFPMYELAIGQLRHRLGM